MRRRRVLGFCVIFAAVVVFLIMFCKSQTGSFDSGTVIRARDVPVVGRHVERLNPSGPIDYIYFRRYNRPISLILVTGKTSTNDFRRFFVNRVRGLEEHDRSAWRNIFQRMRADPCDFCVGEPHKDLIGYLSLWTPKEELVIRGVFRLADSCFTLYTLQVRHPNQSRF